MRSARLDEWAVLLKEGTPQDLAPAPLLTVSNAVQQGAVGGNEEHVDRRAETFVRWELRACHARNSVRRRRRSQEWSVRKLMTAFRLDVFASAR